MESNDRVYVTRLKLDNEYPILEGKIDSPQSAIELMAEYIKDSPTELLLVGNLDTQGQLIDITLASKGDVNMSIVPFRAITQHAVLTNASSCIMMHNHPSGNIQESKEDVKVSERVSKALSVFNIKLLDSIVVSPLTNPRNEHSYNSLAEKGLLQVSTSIDNVYDDGKIYVIDKSNAEEFKGNKAFEEEIEF